MPSASGVRTTVAPSPRISLHFSSANCSGTYNITLYPRLTPISANPTPVLPAVASTIVPPGRSTPRRSASSTRPSAARSFTLPPGFRNSSFAHISAQGSVPLACSSRRRRNIGVSPTSSNTFSATLIEQKPHTQIQPGNRSSPKAQGTPSFSTSVERELALQTLRAQIKSQNSNTPTLHQGFFAGSPNPASPPFAACATFG